MTFLAQLGEGFRTPPKVIKTDELEDEVYWHAPNLSKQRIVGRRDTLLLADRHRVPHAITSASSRTTSPTSSGSATAATRWRTCRIRCRASGCERTTSRSPTASRSVPATQRIHVYEVKVRPKNDTLPRVVGAVYIDRRARQVVRMTLNFTRAAFLDKALEDLSLVLENRLVAGRFWLPSRQEIEIRRKGEWLDYPVRGIIRGRWEIGDYQIQSVAPAGDSSRARRSSRRRRACSRSTSGRGTSSIRCRPDVRAISEPDIQRVQDDARALVRAQALASAKAATLSGRRIEDFVRFNRVEGLAVGAGVGEAARRWMGGNGSGALRDRRQRGKGTLRTVARDRERADLRAVRDRATSANWVTLLNGLAS